jgi:hypothetical protein
MREAIEQYIDREERRERLRQDTLAAWAEYQESGQHVTAAEADAWLARLEAARTQSRRHPTTDRLRADTGSATRQSSPRRRPGSIAPSPRRVEHGIPSLPLNNFS